MLTIFQMITLLCIVISCHASTTKDNLLALLSSVNHTPESVYPSMPVWIDVYLSSISALLTSNFEERQGSLWSPLKPFANMASFFYDSSELAVCNKTPEPEWYQSESKLDRFCSDIVRRSRLKADSKVECVNVLKNVNYLMDKFKLAKVTSEILSKYFSSARAHDFGTIARFIFYFAGPCLLREAIASEFRVYASEMKYLIDDFIYNDFLKAKVSWNALKIVLGYEKSIDFIMSTPLCNKAQEILKRLISIGFDNRVRVLKTNIELMCGHVSVSECLSNETELNSLIRDLDGLQKLSDLIVSAEKRTQLGRKIDKYYLTKVKSVISLLKKFHVLGWKKHSEPVAGTATHSFKQSIRYISYGNSFALLLTDIGMPISTYMPDPPAPLLIALSLFSNLNDNVIGGSREKLYLFEMIKDKESAWNFIAFLNQDPCHLSPDGSVQDSPVDCMRLKAEGFIFDMKKCADLTTPFLKHLKRLKSLLNVLINSSFGFGRGLPDLSLIVNYIWYFRLPSLIENASLLNDYIIKIKGLFSLGKGAKLALKLVVLDLAKSIQSSEAFILTKKMFDDILQISDINQDDILEQRLLLICGESGRDLLNIVLMHIAFAHPISFQAQSTVCADIKGSHPEIVQFVKIANVAVKIKELKQAS